MSAKLFTCVALCAAGVEKVVSNELRKLSLRVLESGFARVRFEAPLEGLYRALLCLRAADRVLLEAADFPAANFDSLFEGVRAVRWEALIPRQLGLTVAKVRASRSTLAAQTSIQAVVHKAAAGRLCERRGLARLPDYGPKAELRVYIENNRARVLLDLSGEPLFKRGYRSQGGGAAPLRETTAAAILLLAGWKRKFPLYDPFCGSGTIALEAALYAWNIAPGLGRRFALSELAFANSRVESQTRAALTSEIDFSRRVRISASDSDPQAAALAETNLRRVLQAFCAPNDHGGGGLPIPPLKFSVLPLGKTRSEEKDTGFIVTNPPWGKRLGDTAASEALYREMGTLPERFPGWQLDVISDHEGFESHFGRKASSCREITCGAVKSYLYEYKGCL